MRQTLKIYSFGGLGSERQPSELSRDSIDALRMDSNYVDTPNPGEQGSAFICSETGAMIYLSSTPSGLGVLEVEHDSEEFRTKAVLRADRAVRLRRLGLGASTD